MNNVIDKITVKVFNNFTKTSSGFNILIAQTIVILFFLWKFNSRDFSFFSYGFEPYYPIEIYKVHNYIKVSGFKFLQDLVSFHWIHWFFSYPVSDKFFLILKYITNIFLFFVLIFGFNFRFINTILYFLLVYQFSYMIFQGQEIDSISIYFGILLVFCFFKSEITFFNISKIKETNLHYGKIHSLLICVFIVYYFGSGLRKLTDLNIFQWFQYDLYWGITSQIFNNKFISGHVPEIFNNIILFNDIDYIFNLFPALVYLSHVIVPIIFFQRNKIIYFAIFYSLFHFMTFGVGISFLGYLFSWFLIIPYFKGTNVRK